jgi:transglutaminase-like putative cysteine protease
MFAGKRAGAARLVLAAGLLAAAAAQAADYRIGPTPAWVRPVPLAALPHPQADAANVAYGLRYDLIDDQVRLAPDKRGRYHHEISEAVTDKGIDALSHHEIAFDASWEKLTLVQLDVIRDGKRVSRLREAQVKVLQRERDLESRIYDGRKSVMLDLPDVRVGDIVEFAYARSGMNPVFHGHHASDFDMQWEVPVAHVHRRLSTAAGLGVHVASLSGAPAPQVSQSEGFDERTWDLHDVPALRMEASVPGSYNPYPWIEWSDFASWADVARWAERLYAVPARLSPGLQSAVDGVARQAAGDDERIVAALRLVQQQVRYLGVEIGAGTHAPSAPDVVWARRWGDCKEKALLMVTMLRALGIEASPALVNTGRQEDIARDLPSAGSFDHVIVRVRHDGRDVWLDPTRAPQQGTLATVTQPDYARALVLDGRSGALATMPAHTVLAHARDVRIDVDSRDGFDKPVRYEVRTTYRGFSADMMRDKLGNGEPGELQRSYLNFYAGSYPGIRVAAPFEVQDDPRANTVVVTEHYAVKDFWPDDGQGARQARFHAPEIDNELQAPAEPIRSMPLALHGPQSVREHLHVRLPLSWPDRKMDQSVANGAFRLHKSIRVHGNELESDDVLEITADQIGASAVAGFTADIGKAQDLLRFSLSTAHSAGWRDRAPLLAGLALIALIALGPLRRCVRAVLARRGASGAAGVGGHAAAANDSRQDLAA